MQFAVWDKSYKVLEQFARDEKIFIQSLIFAFNLIQSLQYSHSSVWGGLTPIIREFVYLHNTSLINPEVKQSHLQQLSYSLFVFPLSISGLPCTLQLEKVMSTQ